MLTHQDSESFLHDGEPIENCNLNNHSSQDRRNFHGIINNDECIPLNVFRRLFLKFLQNLKEKYFVRDFLIVCFDKISMDVLDNIFRDEVLHFKLFDIQIVCLKSILPIFNFPRKRSSYFFEKCWFHTRKYLEDLDCCSRSLLSEAIYENKHIINYQMNWMVSKLKKYNYVRKMSFCSGNIFDSLSVTCVIGLRENSNVVFRNMFLFFSRNISENLYLSALKKLFCQQ